MSIYSFNISSLKLIDYLYPSSSISSSAHEPNGESKRSGFGGDIDNPMPSIVNRTKYTLYKDGPFHYECIKGYEPGGAGPVSRKIDNFYNRYRGGIIYYIELRNGRASCSKVRLVSKYQKNGKWFLELRSI